MEFLTGIANIIRIPFAYADYIVPQLQKYGFRLRRIDHGSDDENAPVWLRSKRPSWLHATELWLTNSGQPLRISEKNASDVCGRILASVQALKGKEVVCFQQVVSYHRPRHLPAQRVHTQRSHPGIILTGIQASKDEESALRKKADEVNLMCTLRVLAMANTKEAGKHKGHNLQHALDSVLGPGQEWQTKIRPTKTVIRHFENGTTSILPSAQLTSMEWATTSGIQIGNPFIAGLAPTMSRQLPAPAAVPDGADGTARIIGMSNFQGAERDVALPYKHAVRHMYVLGPNGSGKTWQLVSMFIQDVGHGYGGIFFDPKDPPGNAIDLILDRLPRNCWDRTVVIDLSDSEYIVPF